MNVKLTPHAEELLDAFCAQRQEPVEAVLEHALDVLARQEHLERPLTSENEARRKAVVTMLALAKQAPIRLSGGVSVRDLVHEGRRI
jgi:hypothetical protein